MLYIRAIRIEVNTENGPFLTDIKFSKGLNIVKGNNTVGKSTVFQSILYGLGVEELLGGKNERTMQSALKDKVEYPTDTFNAITHSQVFLEIENRGKIITTQRSIKGNPSPKLIRVYSSPILTEPTNTADFIDTWIHDKGGASKTERGFHSILENFLEWNLPNVHYSSGEFRKLYLQTVFSSFIVEQKSGWADFLATIPFYGIRNAESRSVEFLLKLDLFENEQRRQALTDRKSNLKYIWKKTFDDLQLVAKRGAIEINGVTENPQILSEVTPINLYLNRGGQKVPLDEILEEWEAQYLELKESPARTIGQNITGATQRLLDRQKKLDELTLLWELLNQNLRSEKNKESQYDQQLKDVREELRQNRDVKKIYKLGGDAGLQVQSNICPTCNQEINDTLFMPDVHLSPMSIDENISYVEAQEKMIRTYLNVVHRNIVANEKQAINLFDEINEIREEIRYLKQELVSDERMPSIADIEKRISLKNKLNLYSQLKNEIFESVATFYSLSDDWDHILSDEKKLPNSYLSANDHVKISILENSFKTLLKRFEYTSKDQRAISISREIDKKFLLPVVDSEGVKYNIRFDSSGSDLIKAIWSYYCALLDVGCNKDTNHPHLLIFDEPAQQGVGSSGFNAMLKELAKYKTAQSFIFSSFNESDAFYREAINDVTDYNLINIVERSIMPKL